MHIMPYCMSISYELENCLFCPLFRLSTATALNDRYMSKHCAKIKYCFGVDSFASNYIGSTLFARLHYTATKNYEELYRLSTCKP